MGVRRLKNATITHVSYVDKGANQKQFFLTKSLDDDILKARGSIEKDVKILVNKDDDEERLVYGVVYEPEVPDAHNDIMSANDIEKSAHKFLADYRNIDKQHDFQGGYGEVVESYVAPQDFTVGGETIAKGSWVLVTKADEETWDSIKKGEITGYSMAGTAEVEEVEKQEDTQISRFVKAMKEIFSGETVEKGKLKDSYNQSRKRRNMFDALWMFEDYIIDEIYKDEPDAESIMEHITDLADILTGLANSTDLIKELKNEYDTKEELQMKKEEMQELLKEAIEPINEKLEALEKDVKEDEVDVEKDEGKDKEEDREKEDVAKQLEDILKEQLAPINERLDKVEKARGISKSLEDDVESEPQEDSVFKSLFEFKGQL